MLIALYPYCYERNKDIGQFVTAIKYMNIPEIAIAKAIASETKVYVDEWVQDQIHHMLKRWSVFEGGCLYNKDGHDIWLDCDIVDGHTEGFVMARKVVR